MSLATILCRVLGHQRAENAINYHSRIRRYTSVCARCAAPLVRRKSGRWEPEEAWRR